MASTLTEMTKLWDKALKKIQTKVDGRTFDYFFLNSYIYDIEGNKLILVAPNEVAKSTLKNLHIDLISSVLNDLSDEEYKITIISGDEIQKNRKTVSKSVQPVEESKPQYFKNSYLDPKLTFDSFVVGEFNKDAHKAAQFVAENDGMLFNPLFIYSNSGLGKTHLMHAIGNEIKRTRMPDAKIVYIAANDFVEEYIKFVRGESDSQSLKSFFDDVDVLLFDDAQLLSGKVKTEEMFFAVYQSLINRGKRIIVTADKQPSELRGLEDRLITRFTQGLTVKINNPDIETCIEILKEKIKNYGLKVDRFDENVLYFIAEKFSRNVRELEGALNSMMFFFMSLDENEKITMDVAIKAVGSIKGGKHLANQLTEQKIINTVAEYYNLTPSQITGKERNAQLVLARHISMYLIRNNLDIPLKKVGEMFGGKDHTTVMSAVSKVDKELKTNEQLKSAIAELTKKIKE